jgi:competence protein ComEA
VLIRAGGILCLLFGLAALGSSSILHRTAIPAAAAASASATAPVSVPIDASPPPSAGLTPDGRVILNQASAEDLARLPRVGPKRAAAILDLRRKLGRFRRVGDLRRVRGIGPKTLKLIEPHVVLDAPDGGA